MSDSQSVPQKPRFEETEAYKEAVALSHYVEQVMDTEFARHEANAALYGVIQDWAAIRARGTESNKEKLNEYLDQLRARYDRGEL